MAPEGPRAESTKYPNNPNKLSPEPTSPHLTESLIEPWLSDVYSHPRGRHTISQMQNQVSDTRALALVRRKRTDPRNEQSST